MNLYFRLIYLITLGWLGPKLSLRNPFISSHIVWPTDLDVFGHVNNGSYYTITDLVRIRILMRSGVLSKLSKIGIYGVLAASTGNFIKPLMPFQRYKIKTQMVGWDTKYIYISHIFYRSETIYTRILVKSRFIGNNGERLSPLDFFKMSDLDKDYDFKEVNLPDYILDWNKSITEERNSA